MRYQDQTYSGMSAAQLAALEADIHDAEYRDSAIDRIDIDEWWRHNDHCYKPRTYFRGYRKRRLMEFIDVASIRDKSVLEVGCGTGGLSVFMALHGARVSGFDLSKVGIDTAAKRAEVNGVADRCDFSVQNASDMPFDHESFDIVVYNAVLHHVLKYPNIREETWRVLKRGGLCVFAEGIRNNPLYRAARLVNRTVTGEKAKGDVDIDVHDLKRFTDRYVDRKMEFLCLTLSVKELIAKRHGNPPGRRALFFLLSHLDRALLGTMPFLGAYCSEVVGMARKPVNAATSPERADACVGA